MEQKKEIRLEKMRVGDFKYGFGNPRKISKKKTEELERSMDLFGDFGIFLVDEDDNVIAGNQRAKILNQRDPDVIVDVKRLIGYTEAELRAINIKDNTHAGEWDFDMLADWTADLTIDLGLEKSLKEELESRKVPEMELIHYEKYDYVLVVCKNSIDYDDLVNRLGIAKAKVHVTNKRTIKGRAVWYDKVKDLLFGPVNRSVDMVSEEGEAV